MFVFICEGLLPAGLKGIMLLMYDDVEANPGPDDTPAVSIFIADVILTTVLATVQRIEQGQISMLSEIKKK